MPVGVTIGAIVVNRKVLDKISPEHQAIIVEENSKASKKLIRKVRRLNRKTLRLLDTKIEKVDLTPAEEKAWQDLFIKAQDALAGVVYSKAMLEKVRNL